jgi:16S rRNA processing protein RimM
LEKQTAEFLAVARVVRPRGRVGEVTAEILTDFPDRFSNLQRVYLESPGLAPAPARIEKAWHHKGRIVLKFSGVDSIQAADSLRDRHVLVPIEEKAALLPDSYFWHDLVGCRVVMAASPHTEVGAVTEVERTGGVELLHVARRAPRESEVLIPFATAICTKIDLETREIVIDPPEDLLDL